MTVEELIKKLDALKPEIKRLEVVVIAQNGLEGNPQIKFVKENDDIFGKFIKVVLCFD